MAVKFEKRNGPGRPSTGKMLVTLRLDPDIIAFFRASGPKWQPRVNEVLRRSMKAQLALQRARTAAARKAASGRAGAAPK